LRAGGEAPGDEDAARPRIVDGARPRIVDGARPWSVEKYTDLDRV
jgi:hypothetical protein